MEKHCERSREVRIIAENSLMMSDELRVHISHCYMCSKILKDETPRPNSIILKKYDRPLMPAQEDESITERPLQLKLF